MPSLNQIKGKKYEDRALEYFQNQNYELIYRNVLIEGVEVDLVLRKNNTYYIVEVKSDNSWRLENPLSYKQLHRLKRAALALSETSQCSTRLLLALVNNKNQVQTYFLDDE